jgi:ElaB/YqjD/DUF883 family membrane-anchored ribosome-binding protein
MSHDETFAEALRAEIVAVVSRYEALVRALGALGNRETEALRAEAATLAADNHRLRAAEADARDELATLRSRVDDLSRELDDARARCLLLEGQAHAAMEATLSYEEQFTAERRFVEACRDLAGSLLGDALAATLGRPLEPTSPSYAALKARGLEPALTAAVKDRGRSALSAPLLERERTALAALAMIAGCELVTPPSGTRFAAASMERASQVSEPAEEGNVVDCAMPGLRRAGTEGALVFPRVVVATG